MLLQVTLYKGKTLHFVIARGDTEWSKKEENREKSRMAQCACHNRGIVTEE